MLKDTVTPREAAQELGVRLDTVYAMVWAGRLEADRVDGRWLIKAAAVRELKQKRAEAKPRSKQKVKDGKKAAVLV